MSRNRVIATHRPDLHAAIVNKAKQDKRHIEAVTDEVIETGLSVRRIPFEVEPVNKLSTKILSQSNRMKKLYKEE